MFYGHSELYNVLHILGLGSKRNFFKKSGIWDRHKCPLCSSFLQNVSAPKSWIQSQLVWPAINYTRRLWRGFLFLAGKLAKHFFLGMEIGKVYYTLIPQIISQFLYAVNPLFFFIHQSCQITVIKIVKNFAILRLFLVRISFPLPTFSLLLTGMCYPPFLPMFLSHVCRGRCH